MNYKIIYDLKALEEFIDTILPDLTTDECFYVSLFARKKYSRDVVWSSDKSQLKRITCTKKNLIQKLKQLEISIGNYLLGDRIVPQEALVVYIHPNPRSQVKAARVLIKKMADLIAEDAHGFNVQQEALSAIQKSIGNKVYVDFDFDLESKKDLNITMFKVLQYINNEAVTFVETRGGLHALIKLNSIDFLYEKTWYKNIRNLGSDVEGDCLIPIPGCIQGGFVPKIITY